MLLTCDPGRSKATKGEKGTSRRKQVPIEIPNFPVPERVRILRIIILLETINPLQGKLKDVYESICKCRKQQF